VILAFVNISVRAMLAVLQRFAIRQMSQQCTQAATQKKKKKKKKTRKISTTRVGAFFVDVT
jgi:hypothetical protein